MPEVKEPSISHRIIAIIGGTASFVITVWIFFTLFSPKAEANVAVVMSVISGVVVGWIVLSLSGVLKQFSLKSPFFEMTANIEKKVDEIKIESKDLKNDVSKINQRIDTVITNQLSVNQSQSIIINGIEREKQNVGEQLHEKIKRVSPKQQISFEEEDKIPETEQKQIDSLMSEEKFLNKILKNYYKTLPLDVELTLQKANYLYGVGDYKIAKDYYEKILEVEPRNLDALYNIAICEGRMGNNLKSIEYLESYLEKSKENPKVFVSMSKNYSELAQPQKSLEFAEKAITLDGNYGVAWYNKACALSLLDKKDESLTALKSAINIEARFKDSAQKDKDFEKIKNDSEFQKIINS